MSNRNNLPIPYIQMSCEQQVLPSSSKWTIYILKRRIAKSCLAHMSQSKRLLPSQKWQSSLSNYYEVKHSKNIKLHQKGCNTLCPNRGARGFRPDYHAKRIFSWRHGINKTVTPPFTLWLHKTTAQSFHMRYCNLIAQHYGPICTFLFKNGQKWF